MLGKLNLEPIFNYLQNTSLYKIFFTSIICIVTIFMIALIYVGVDNFEKVMTIIDHPTTSEELDKELEDNIKRNLKINILLSRVLDETESDRATLFKFHNGKSGLNGVAFLFYSASHQQIAIGTSNSITDLQEIHLSIDPVGLQKLLEKKCYLTTSNTTNLLLRNIMNKVGTKLDIKCPVYANNYLIGFISISYTRRQEVDSSVIDILKDYTKKMERLSDDL